MTYDQITNLLEKGFTPDQIMTLTSSAAEPTPAADNAVGDGDPVQPSAVNPEPAAPETTPEPEATPAPDHSQDILAAIADLKSAVQAKNINTMSVETVNSEDALEKAMAEFIRPSLGKGEK